jgi:hypothetical protein
MKQNILGMLAIAMTCISTGAIARSATATEMVLFSGALNDSRPVVDTPDKDGAKDAHAAPFLNTKVTDLNSHRSPKPPATTTSTDATGTNDQGAPQTSGNDSKTGAGAPYVPTVNVPKPTMAPEIDASSMASALTLLLGAVAVLRGRRKEA